MANVYTVGQESLIALAIQGTGVLKSRPITDAAAVVFGIEDLTMADVMTNSGGSPLTQHGTDTDDETLTGVDVVVTGTGTDIKAAKSTWTAVSGPETWIGCFIYDATTDTNDTSRIPICYLDFTADIDANGSNIEILYNNVDPGVFVVTVNSA